MGNIYFELTRQLNDDGPVAILASGQAVVFHRLAMMSKDGDWILRESEAACGRALRALGERNAFYRSGAPLDVRWLSGGWSSHLEFRDDGGRRIRCDFFTRPPRIPMSVVEEMFARPKGEETLLVVDIEPLIWMKQTQRAKDYAVIGELARRLSPTAELALTTDPDRVLELASQLDVPCERPCVRAARRKAERGEVVGLLAVENDQRQRVDRARVERYQRAAEPFFRAARDCLEERAPLAESHAKLIQLAVEWLPTRVDEEA